MPDGGKDENVFNITQGASINIFVKTGRKKAGELAEVFYCDLYGRQNEKYDFLSNNDIKTVTWDKLRFSAPQYFFAPKDFLLQKEYEKGFSLQELFPINGAGITTAHDEFVISENQQELFQRFETFKKSSGEAHYLHEQFKVSRKEGWNIVKGWSNIQNKELSAYIKPISYRPFDTMFIFYEDSLVWRTVKKVMRHFLKGENIGLIASRQCVSDWRYIFITKDITDFNLTGTAGRFGSGYAFPLYIYPNKLFADEKRKSNLKKEIVEEISKQIKLRFTEEKENNDESFAPIDLLDYIYAHLHSPAYREKYKEFLKIDFPRVPYPHDASEFWAYAAFGKTLRELHLLETAAPQKNMANFPKAGNNTIEKLAFKDSKVWINAAQYFDNVPQTAWEFYIGGYQPAQKWLKDRKNRTMTYEEIEHYQKIIFVLSETDKIMKKIDDNF
ncbi:MAG: hypothetical protein LBB59_00705 [Campylobacteraceae bacterium]|nr:hypothetical protein [Campylobacteraceae bacterium]